MGAVKDVRRVILAAAVEAENCGAPESIVGELERAVITLAIDPRPGSDPDAELDHAVEALRRWEHWLAMDSIARERRAASSPRPVRSA